jgi:transposase
VRRTGAESRCPTEVKVELVLRSLAGETLADLAREVGRPRKQLSAWRQRFLTGGEAYLDGRRDRGEAEELRVARGEINARLIELEAENQMLARRLAMLGPDRPSGGEANPYCSELYAKACEEPGARPLQVPEWGTYVLVREGPGGGRQATGVRPLESLDPRCDVKAGLDALRDAGVASMAMVTDPMWSPELSVLRGAFDACRPFREHYLVDRDLGVHIRKRHRNRINQARRAGKVRELSLSDHLERWLELYQGNVDSRQIPQPFTPTYFERLAQMPSLKTVAVAVEGEIASMTLWVSHGDVLYFHDGASSSAGMAVSAAYAAFAHAIDTAECRYVLLGGSAGISDERLDGLAMFKRGFANASAASYLCNVMLRGAVGSR